MSKYTTELRFICENLSGNIESKGGDSVASIIAAARPLIFNFDYPIFDSTYKAVLETKILRHFYTREICEETYGLWKLRLNDKLNIIMPYYNKLYESELLNFNPLYDVDYTIASHKVGDIDTTESGSKGANTTTNSQTLDTVNGSNTESTSDSGTTWSLYSDTPQGSITGVDNNTYLTSAQKGTNSQTGSRSVTSNKTDAYSGNTTNTYSDTVSRTNAIDNIEDYTEHVQGKRGGTDFSKLITSFRKTFLNIDKEILDELEPLFFGLW